MERPRFQLEEVTGRELRALGPTRSILEGRLALEEVPVDVSITVVVLPRRRAAGHVRLNDDVVLGLEGDLSFDAGRLVTGSQFVGGYSLENGQVMDLPVPSRDEFT